MNIIGTMNQFFKDMGFEKVKKTFFKNINDDYVAAVELSRERNYTIIEGNLHTATNLDYYNIYISIYHKIEIEAYSMIYKDMGSFYPLTAIAGIEESEWLENNPDICDSMKNTFTKNIYEPLFISKKLFDFIYNLDLKRFGEHRYDSDELLMASYDEKRYDITEKCLHAALAIMLDPDCRGNMLMYDHLTIEDLIAELETSQNRLSESEKLLFTEYKDVYFNMKKNK